MAADSFAVVAHAARAGDMAVVSEWIDNNVDVNQPLDGAGNTALHYLCQAGRQSHNEDLLLFLLGSGANPSARNNAGQTPLHVACQYDNLDAVRVLLQFGADPLDMDKSQSSCFAIAKQNLNADVMAELKKYSPGSFDSQSDHVHSDKVVLHFAERTSSTASLPSQDSVQLPKATVPAYNPSTNPPPPKKMDQATTDLVSELQRQVTNLQKENLLLESKVRSAEETKKRLDAALNAKVELEVLMQQKQMEVDNAKFQQEKREKEVRQRELNERVNATSSLEMEKLHLESEVRRLSERLEQEIEEKMTFKAQLDVSAGAMEEMQAAVRVFRAEKAKADVQLANLESLRSTVADLQQQNNLLRLDVDAAQSLRPALNNAMAQKVQLEGQLREMTNEMTEVKSQLAIIQARNKEAEASVQEQQQHLQMAASMVQELQQDRTRMQVQLQGMAEELLRLRSKEQSPLDAEMMIERLQQEKGNLTTRVMVSEQQVAQLKEEMTKLREEKLAMGQQCSQFPALQARIESQEHEVAHLEEEVTKLRQQCETLTEANQKLQREKAGLDNTLKDMLKYQDLYESLVAEKEQLEGEVAKKAAALLDAEAAIKENQRIKQESQKQYNESEQKALALERDLGSLQRELRRALEDVARLKREQQVHEDNSGDTQLEREVLQSRILNAQAENLKLLGEVKRLQDEVAFAQEEARRYKSDNELYLLKLDQNSRDVESSWTKHKQQKEELEARLAEEMTKNSTLQDEKLTKTEEVQHLKDELREVRVTCQGLQRELDDTLHTLDLERQRLMLMNQERQGLELQMKALRDQASIAPSVRGTVPSALSTPAFSEHRFVPGHQADFYHDVSSMAGTTPRMQAINRLPSFGYGPLQDPRLQQPRPGQLVASGGDETTVAARPILGALREDERRERMGPRQAIMAKAKGFPNKAMEAEAFFAAHRRLAQR